MRSLCRRPPEAARPRREVWGDRLGLHQLPRGHGPLAIYFAFCHQIGTAGAIRTHKFLLLRELPLPDSATAALIGEPYGCRSHRDGLKGRLLRRLLTVHVGERGETRIR